MAVSVTSRPSTWSAVKNPLVYKFATTGGPFTNYRIEVEVFKASDDTSLTGGVKFAFTPDADDNTIADISAIIKAYLGPEWIEPSALNEVEADTSLEFYIKYQELYDGSATSPVDDVANPRFAVLAALQIPSANGNNLTDYVPADDTKKFLTVFDRPKYWRGYPATLSFIHPSGLALWILKRQYSAAGALLISSLFELDSANADTVNRTDLFSDFFGLNDATKTIGVKLQSKVEFLLDGTFADGVDPGPPTNDWWNFENPDTPNEPWVSSGATGVEVPLTGATLHSEQLAQNTGTLPAGDYRFVTTAWCDFAGDPTIIEMVIRFYNGLTLINEFSVSSGSLSGTPSSITFTATVSGTFNHFRVLVRRASAINDGTIHLDDISLHQYQDYTEELTVDVEDPCDNPILLFWKNSLGGDAWWMFDYGQEAGYNYSGQKKAKRMTLFGELLTLGQWEALNELNTLGEVYQENITELTSSINKTAIRDGAQVYMVDEDGNKTGVIVIPSNSVINTRDELHSVEIEIEHPERVE